VRKGGYRKVRKGGYRKVLKGGYRKVLKGGSRKVLLFRLKIILEKNRKNNIIIQIPLQT
jgi:hypothetical protein